MKDLISIIIPVYNAELYLRRCIDSVINQSYKNLEIILIDDGSSDSSSKICDDYAKNDKRIIVVHTKNSGVSSARNSGIKISKGNYIAFVDSDDWIDKDFIRILYTNITNNKADLSVCSYLKTKNLNINMNIKYSEINNLTQEESYYHLIKDNNFAGYLWNKMYSKKIIDMLKNDLINEELHVCEDLEFNTRYLEKISKVVHTNSQLYFYFSNPISVTANKKINDKILTIIDAYKMIKENYEKNAPNYIDLVCFESLRAKININFRLYTMNKQKVLDFKDDNEYKKVLKGKNLKITQKIYMIISYKFPIITSRIKVFINNKRK